VDAFAPSERSKAGAAESRRYRPPSVRFPLGTLSPSPSAIFHQSSEAPPSVCRNRQRKVSLETCRSSVAASSFLFYWEDEDCPTSSLVLSPPHPSLFLLVFPLFSMMALLRSSPLDPQPLLFSPLGHKLGLFLFHCQVAELFNSSFSACRRASPTKEGAVRALFAHSLFLNRKDPHVPLGVRETFKPGRI